MASRSQQILVKRAQREAGLGDAEYRDVLEGVSGCRSTTDPRMTDRHVDLALAYMEAIYWRKVDLGELQPSGQGAAVFRQRGYWAGKNPREATSRDRFSKSAAASEISRLEAALGKLGFGPHYCEGIRSKVTHGGTDARALWLYKVALERTFRAKHRQASVTSQRATG